MSKKSKKIIIKLIFITILFSFMLSSFLSISIANPTGGIEPGEITGDLTKVQDLVNKVLGVLVFFGIFLSVLMIIVLGINYFTAAHNPEEKSKVNQRMQSIALGTLLIIGSTSILTLIYNTINKTIK